MKNICLHNEKLYRNNLISICMYILGILIILNHSIYYYTELGNKIISNLLVVWTIISFMVVCKAKIRITNEIKKGMCIYMTLALLYAVCGDITGGAFSYIVRYLLFVPLMILILSEAEKNCRWSFLFTLSNIIYVLAIVSLIGWCIISVFPNFPNQGFVETSWGEIGQNGRKGVINYFYVYFISQRTYFGKGPTYRNSGIFCEGPAYAFIISLSLLTEIFLKKNKNKKRIFILWITMGTTLTTSGILYFAFFNIFKWYFSKKNDRKIKTLLIPVLFIVFCTMVIVLIKYKTNQRSVSIRLDSYGNAINAFIKQPLFGYGYKYAVAEKFNAGITDSFSDILVCGGICFVSIYLIPFLVYPIKGIIRVLKEKKRIYELYDENFVFVTFALYVFMTTILSYTFIMLTFISYGYLILEKRERNAFIKQNKDYY